jgi:hypothetical protein
VTDPRYLSRGIRVAAAGLAVDRTTGEIFDALDAAEVPALLLKGPGVALWLYTDPTERPYGDTDLLVPPQAEAAAQGVLRELGFRPSTGTGEPDPDGVALNHIWQRGNEMAELHVSLVGIRAARELAWQVLSAQADKIEVGGRPVPVPCEAARAFHLAGHAAQHGRLEPKPLHDLELGIERLSLNTWREAAQIAQRLDATSAFTIGLSLIPAWASLLRRLHIEVRRDVEATLRAENQDLALGFARLAKLPTRRAKLARLVHVAFPNRSFMRWWTPLARRGPASLAVAYLWRPIWLVTRGPGAFRAWQVARRRARDQ